MRRRIHPPPFLIARIIARTGGIRDTHVIGRQNPYEVHDNNSQSGYCDNGKGGVSSIIPDKKREARSRFNGATSINLPHRGKPWL